MMRRIRQIRRHDRTDANSSLNRARLAMRVSRHMSRAGVNSAPELEFIANFNSGIGIELELP